ncbi:MAG: hypothetical protein IKG40_02015 [Bacilli bacterium]|nr:hypothetical protein [Bacilli bacterium]
MQGLKLSNKIEIGVDFNVVSNPITHEVLPSESKYIRDGEVITSFTIKDGNIVKICSRDTSIDYATDEEDLQYAVENIFNYVSPTDLMEIVENMNDEEKIYLEGLKIIRLLNFYTS